MTDEQRVKRRGRILLIVIALLSIAPLYDQYGHPVRVYDGSTGEPLEGAFAVGRWGASAWVSFVGSSSVCYKLTVARAGESGQLYMPKWSWSGRALVLDHSGHFFSGGDFFVYRPGYYEGPSAANPPGQRIMWRDARSPKERLLSIESDQQRASCFGAHKVHRIAQLAPLHDAMLREAESLANSPSERIALGNIRWERNYLLYGEEVATEINRKKRKEESGR